MHIGEFSRLIGLHPGTLRKLERRGLISPPARDYNDRRVYSAKDVEQVRQLLARQRRPAAREAHRIGSALQQLEHGG